MDCKSSPVPPAGSATSELQKLAAGNQSLVQCLISASEHDDYTEAILILRDIKNLTIGSDKQKRSMFILQLFSRLVSSLLQLRSFDETEFHQTQIELISVLCSLIKLKASRSLTTGSFSPQPNTHFPSGEASSADYGSSHSEQGNAPNQHHASNNNEQQLDGLTVYLIDGMTSPNEKVAETCARCLRCLFASKMVSPEILFEPIENEMDTTDSNPIFEYSGTGGGQDTPLDRLMKVFSDCSASSKLVFVMSCLCSLLDHDVTETLGHCDWLKLKNRQNILVTRTCILQIIPTLLLSGKHALIETTLDLIVALSFRNAEIASKFVTELRSKAKSKSSCVSIICDSIQWDKPRKQQMKCCRVLINFLNLGVLQPSWPKFTHKVLPTLVRMCKNDCHPKHRIEAALLIYQLTQSSAELQLSAIITERLVALLTKYLAFKNESSCTVKEEVKYFDGMRVAAFKALSSLSANNTDVSKNLVEDSLLMDNLIQGLSDVSTNVQYATLLLLLSLTRSIPLLMSYLRPHLGAINSSSSSHHHLAHHHHQSSGTNNSAGGGAASSIVNAVATTGFLNDTGAANAVLKPVIKVLAASSNSAGPNSSDLAQVPNISLENCFAHNNVASQQAIVAQDKQFHQFDVTKRTGQSEMKPASHSVGSDDDLILVASAVMCNLTLPTPPFCGLAPFGRSSVRKEELLSAVCPFLTCSNCQIRLNAVWILMNYCYMAPSEILLAVWNSVVLQSTELLLSLLTDSFFPVRIKMAALLRNLTASANELEEVMASKGDDLMGCLITALDWRRLYGNSSETTRDNNIRAKEEEQKMVQQLLEQLLLAVANICTVPSTCFHYVIDSSDVMNILQYYLMKAEWKERLTDVQLACIKVIRNCVTSACAADGCEQILGGIGTGGGVAPGAGLSKVTTILHRHNLVAAIKYIATSPQQSPSQAPPPSERGLTSSSNAVAALGMVEDFTDSSGSFSPASETMHSSPVAGFCVTHPFEMQIISEILQKVS